jgi:hypothetical protein
MGVLLTSSELPEPLEGGTWRIGASATSADTDFADQLHDELNAESGD